MTIKDTIDKYPNYYGDGFFDRTEVEDIAKRYAKAQLEVAVSRGRTTLSLAKNHLKDKPNEIGILTADLKKLIAFVESITETPLD